MPRRVVPILPAPDASSRSASRSRWIGRISGQVSAIISTSGVTLTPWPATRSTSAFSAHGSSTTPLPITDGVPRTIPDGRSDSLYVWSPTTSVCPALWPPWKRTTMSARLASQSTILPLPSSPHCAPMTVTLPKIFPLVRAPARSYGAVADASRARHDEGHRRREKPLPPPSRQASGRRDGVNLRSKNAQLRVYTDDRACLRRGQFNEDDHPCGGSRYRPVGLRRGRRLRIGAFGRVRP